MSKENNYNGTYKERSKQDMVPEMSPFAMFATMMALMGPIIFSGIITMDTLIGIKIYEFSIICVYFLLFICLPFQIIHFLFVWQNRFIVVSTKVITLIYFIIIFIKYWHY